MKKENCTRWKVEEYILLLIIIIFILLYFFSSVHRYFDHDEFEAAHTAWKILNGETIYIDFFQHHHPLLYYLLVPIVKILGERAYTLLSLRLIFFVLCLSIVLVTYKLASNLCGRKVALISALLLLSADIFFKKSIEIRPDVPQTLFGLLSILLLLKYLKNKKPLYSILSSLSLGISFLFLQKALFLIIGIAVVLLLEMHNNKINFKEASLYVFFLVLSLFPYFVYLLANGYFSTYLLLNWTINIKSPLQFYPARYILPSFQKCSVMWLFYFVGLPIFFTKSNVTELCVISAILLTSALLAKAPYQQYYLPALPLVAIISASCIANIISYKSAIIYLLILGIALPMYSYINLVSHFKNDYQLTKIQYVLNHTSRKDYVYDGNILFNVFRKDIDYFWFSVRPKTGLLATYQILNPSYKYDIYRKIQLLKPKIISNYYINTSHRAIKSYYRQSPIYKDLYLRNKLEPPK